MDEDLSMILKKKNDEFCDALNQHNLSEIDYPRPRFNDGKPIRLGIVKLADERKDVESSMLFIDGACGSQKNWRKVILQFYYC